MNSTAQAFEYFVRRGLAILLIPAALFFAVMFVGMGNATTDVPHGQLYAEAVIYVGLTVACIVVAFRAEGLWIGWAAVLLGWAPLLLLFGPARA